LLTRSLLSFAQRAPIQPTRFDLNGPVADVAGTFGRTLLQPVTFSCTPAAAALPVHLDREQFGLVLLNLLVNARDATQTRGTTIRLATACTELDATAASVRRGDLAPGPYALVRVDDDGSGIEEADLARVTEPFFTTKGRSERSGLGLSMASGFARQSRGTLEIASQPGLGTSVSLFFPLAGKPEATAIGAATRHPLKGLRALLLEDDEALRTLTVRILARAGLDVLAAGDSDEAARHLDKTQNIDVAILDHLVPGRRSGADIAREVKAHAPALPVLLLSGHIAPIDAEIYGIVDAVLQKPVSSSRLLGALEACLARGSG
jgi:CheY-like chemotaxis protein/uncharacterized protein (DUF2141 family)